MTELDRKAVEAGAHPDCDCDDCLAIYEGLLGGQYGTNPETGEPVLAWTDSQGSPQG